MAHSDSVPTAPGAADDGFGLAVALEAARVLAAEGARFGVLITDREEEGLLGAIQHARAASGARLVLNLEARGASGPVYMFQLAGDPDPLLEAWRTAGCRAQTSSLAATVYAALPNDTDFTVFRRKGWSGYDFALIHDAWRYHTPDDVPAGLDPGSVQQAGDCVVGLVRAWAEQTPPTPRASDRAWQQLSVGLFEAPLWLVRAAATVLLGAAVLRGRHASNSGPGGALALAGATLGAGLLGAALTVALGVAGVWTRPAEIPHPEPVYAAALGMGIAAAALAWKTASRWTDPAPGWHRAVAVVAAVAALAVPEAGYVLVPGGFVSALLARGQARWAAPFAVLAGLFVAPVLYAVPVALTTRMSLVVVLLPVLLLGWMAPARRA